MRRGLTPSKASETAVLRIAAYYPNFSGAVIAASKTGVHGAACHGMATFSYCVYNNDEDRVQVFTVQCV